MAEVNASNDVGTKLAHMVRDNLNLPLSDGDIQDILGEVRANHVRLEGCPRHDFQQIEPGKFGTKFQCAACGGMVDGINVNWYKRGLEHAKVGPDATS